GLGWDGLGWAGLGWDGLGWGILDLSNDSREHGTARPQTNVAARRGAAGHSLARRGERSAEVLRVSLILR
uniref:hypothetical protein n=1 Tax=Amycolatopsis orientalis TaxID=31958 RepID=UPI001F2E0CB2